MVSPLNLINDIIFNFPISTLNVRYGHFAIDFGPQEPVMQFMFSPPLNGEGSLVRPGMMGKRDFFRMRLTYSLSLSFAKEVVPVNKLQNASGVRRTSEKEGREVFD